jgi:hypothetical protein
VVTFQRPPSTARFQISSIGPQSAGLVRDDPAGGLDGTRGLLVSERDRCILARAREKLHASSFGWADAIYALRESVEELIPAGRCYFLGKHNDQPVIGSVISGVGITEGLDGSVWWVTRDASGRFTPWGTLGP